MLGNVGNNVNNLSFFPTVKMETHQVKKTNRKDSRQKIIVRLLQEISLVKANTGCNLCYGRRRGLVLHNHQHETNSKTPCIVNYCSRNQPTLTQKRICQNTSLHPVQLESSNYDKWWNDNFNITWNYIVTIRQRSRIYDNIQQVRIKGKASTDNHYLSLFPLGGIYFAIIISLN